MTAHSRSLKELFLAALDMAPEAREAWLERACADDAALREHLNLMLAAHDAPQSLLDRPAAALPADLVPPTCLAGALDQPVTEKPGSQIGPYKLLQQIGEGGFGVVFMAEQLEPVRRKVALKVIKPGMDTRQVIARFEAERQALAVMDHPNIARVLDAGATESGRPYFVMELVRGVPITTYCDENNLPIRERLTLFATVCQAIQHAHTKGIIHRDIKPSNVLVTRQDGQGVAKVIDFGVAKAMGQQLTDKTLFTEFAQMIGTPLYMSPEQADLSSVDIDTRSDIYSLGVLLYELLTGTTPVDKEQLKKAAFDEIRRIIREEDPPKPSTRISTAEAAPSIAAHRQTEPTRLTKLVRGELDWIAMKALDKDRNRRYETANGLAMDVRRYLADEPVLACPPSAGYRLRKFARRNKRPVLAAFLVLLALVIGIVGTSWGLVRARQAEGQARTEAKKAVAERQRANLETERAKKERRTERLRFYASQINLAHQALQGREHTRAIQILDELRPPAGDEDFRTFEWYYLWRICHYGSRAVLRGHSDTVTALVFLADNRTLVSGSRDGTVRLWDWNDGTETWRFPEKLDCSSLAVSDDNLLAVGSNDGFITCWDLKTRNVLCRLDTGAAIRTIAISRDGSFVVSGGRQKFQVWNVATGKEDASQEVTAEIVSVAMSPSGTIATTDWHEVNLWSWDGQELRRGERLTAEGSGPPAAYSPDGRFLAIGHLNLTLFEAATLKARTVDANRSGRRAIAFSPDTEQVAVGGDDRAVRIYRVDSGAEIASFPHLAPVHAVAFSVDGGVIASSGADQVIKVWDLRFQPSELSLDVSKQSTGYGRSSLAFSPEGNALVAGGFWDRATLGKLSGPPEAVGPFALSVDGKILAYAADMGAVAKIWDVGSQRVIASLTGHTGTLWHCAFSRDATSLITCEEAGDGATTFGAHRRMENPNIIRWNMQTRVGTHLNPGYWVRCAAFSPDGLTMATGGHQNSVTLWDVATWQPRLHLQQGGDGWVEQLAFSPDRGTLAVSESNGFVKLYEVATWRIRAVLRSHTGWIWGLAFSPDGRTLATGSHDRTIGFWDVQTGQERMTIRGLPRPVWATAFSPDGKTLGSLDQDGVVRLWPTASGEMGVTVEQNPSEPEYWLRRAALLVRRGDWDGARQDFLAAVELRPDDLVLLGRIASLCLRCDRGQEAATIYDRAIERSPANAILKARRAQLQPGVVAVWNFDAGSEDWGSPHQCNVSVSDGALIIKTQGTDPWIIVTVDGAAGWKELTLRVRTDQECQAQLFWAIEEAPQFAEDRSVHFEIEQGQWEWTEVKVRFQPESALSALRLDPVYDGEVHWEIDAATLASVAPPQE